MSPKTPGTVYWRYKREGARYHVIHKGSGRSLCGRRYSRNDGLELDNPGHLAYWGICRKCKTADAKQAQA